MEPYYEHAGVTIYHGDCREIAVSLGQEDVVLSDPPYGIQHSSGHGASWQNTHIANDHNTDMRDWLVKETTGLSMAVFGTWKVCPPLNARSCLVWDKGPASGMGDLSMPWKPSWDLIWIFGDRWMGRRDEGVLRGHIIVSWETKGRFHPHQKPVSLLQAILKKAPAGMVFDPFMGSGSTLIAAKHLGRKSIGIEIEEKYCEIAAKRLGQEVFSFS